MRSRNPSCWAKTASRASPTVEPSTFSSASPSVAARSWVGIFTVTPIALDADLLLHLGLEAGRIRIDLVHLEPFAGRVERLQALAGDHDHDTLSIGDRPALGELGEHRSR